MKFLFLIGWILLLIPATSVAVSVFPAAFPTVGEVIPTAVEAGTLPDRALPTNVRYLLDQEGRPYVISVYSEDPEWTRRFLKLLGETAGGPADDRETFGITIYYHYIR